MKGRVRMGALALAIVVVAVFAAATNTSRSSAKYATAAPPANGCQLNSPKGQVKHVIYLIFDNVHFLRDNPNVPSDLEQMPHLLNFIRGNGTLMTNDHTVLISHTANGILTNLTGTYSDRHGQAVSNSYRYFRADGTTASSSSFKYWTDLTDDVNTPPTDPNFNMVNGDSGTPRNAPAPWVPYTRAGCDFGATALANVVLENTGTGPAGDMTKVFGTGSPEWLEAQASNAAPANTAARNLAQTDFVGMAVHCAQSADSICAGNANARPDQLPDEPGGYTGFEGLFGAKYVNPAICTVSTQNCTNGTVNGQTAVKKLNGTPITDQFGQPGFPGFDGMFATISLSLRRADAGGRHPGHLRLHLGRTRPARRRPATIHCACGPRRGRLRPAAAGLRHGVRAVLQPPGGATGSTRATRCSCSPSRRATTSPAHPPTNPGCDGVTTPCTYTGNASARSTATCAGLVNDRSTATRRHSRSTRTWRRTSTSPATRRETAPVTRNLEREMSDS